MTAARYTLRRGVGSLSAGTHVSIEQAGPNGTIHVQQVARDVLGRRRSVVVDADDLVELRRREPKPKIEGGETP